MIEETDETARAGAAGRLTGWSARHPRLVAAAGLLLGVVAVAFSVSHFAITTDTNRLISGRLPWRQREATFNALFQPHGDRIVVVIDGATPERADEAAAALAARLASRGDLIAAVSRPDALLFFRQNGLLFETEAQVRGATAKLVAAQPFLGPLAADPSARGLMSTLSTAAQGVASGQANLGDLQRPLRALTTTFNTVIAGKPAFLSWRTLISGAAASASDRRRIVIVDPRLDYRRLQPGAAAADFIRAAARDLRLDPAHGARVRLTGDAPLADDQLGSLADHAGWIGLTALAAIILMLWLAVRSPRLIGAILATMLIGLVVTAALGLAIFQRFNVISVAFIPLFVGLGIDFGIQFSVRFRAEQAAGLTGVDALTAAGAGMGRSLTLAALAIAAGFLAFGPTAYVGLSQLGVIAGAGMLIALALNLSVLPALIALLAPPPPEPRAGRAWLERIDTVVLGHRRAVIAIGVAGGVLGAALLPWLRFDFNPLHLMNPASPSVATLRDLMRDPDLNPNTLEVVTPSLAAADRLAGRLRALPQVADARTLSSFVPGDQPAKLARIADAASLLDLTLDPLLVQPPPTDGETIAALRQTAVDLRAAAAASPTGGADATRLARSLEALADGSAASRAAAREAVIPGLQTLLDQTREALSAQPVTLASLPAMLSGEWLAGDGRARVSVIPRGDSDDTGVLRRFIAAVTRLAPDATGPARDTYEGGRTVAGAFLQAGALSLAAITLLLFAALRRTRDVAITLAPIFLTLLLTLGSCVAIGQPLNFANIIAFPLLAGIGVAFHIYFVLAWRAGGAHLLQSSLTRAIFFSALATATGFGSLWASSHPGTASMGKLLMISLIWTLVSALLFQPALMGAPRVTDSRR